jgi:hypothetical protein
MHPRKETISVATPLWAKCEGEAHTPKSGNLESSGTPENSELELKGQNTSHCGFLGVIEKVLKCRCLTGLALAIWTSSAQVMGKRRAGSQIGSLTPDHYKSGIDLFPTYVARVRHGVGKLSRRDTTLVQTSSRSELMARSYGCPKFQESKPGQFRDSTWES